MHTISKKILIRTVLLLSALFLAGCGSRESNSLEDREEPPVGGVNCADSDQAEGCLPDGTIAENAVLVSFDQSILESSLQAGQEVILFFTDDTCVGCDSLRSSILADADVLSGDSIRVLEVNIDENTSLVDEYGVSDVHTLVYLNSDASVSETRRGVVNAGQMR